MTFLSYMLTPIIVPPSNYPPQAICGEGAYYALGQRLPVSVRSFHPYLQQGFVTGATEESASPTIPQLTWKQDCPVWVDYGPFLGHWCTL